jgi:hypothetical protein
MKKILANEADKRDLLRRLQLVQPDSQRRWGKMTPHQMICHLNDSFKAGTGEKEVGSSSTLVSRTIMKWFALNVPVPWPHGLKTRPEMDQDQGGTKPGEFRRDAEALAATVERFSQAQRDFTWGRHPLFAEMTDSEWLRWGYLHMDHHLRQFGV